MGKNSSKLTPKDLQDLRTLTEFTDEEIHRWFRSFVNDVPRGKLTLHEFQDIYSQIFPLGDAKVFSSHAFNTFDTNKDGTIDFREFLCALSLIRYGHVEEKLKWAFKMYDIDGDGYISRMEMNEITEALNKMLSPYSPHKDSHQKLPNTTDDTFTRMDTNNDGKISIDEFIEGSKKNPSILNMLSFAGPKM